MKNINLGQIVQILANVGVIAGIVFLAVELQQNNDLLEAEARASRADIRRGSYERMIDNPDVVRIIIKARSGEGLTEREDYLLTRVLAYILTGWQYVYGEYEAGLIDKEDIPIDGWRVWFHGDMRARRDYWREAKDDSYRPDFVQWMEENVVSR